VTQPLLSVRAVAKRFGNVQALNGVDLDFRAGEIHALLGENGAGKSTLMHVLTGLVRPDRGQVWVDGVPLPPHAPRAARRAGIGMVHQHFTLVGALTVAENLALSLPAPAAWRFDAPAIAAGARALAERVGLELSPPDVPVSALPVGACQRLEILKALAGGARVLILDEPTAVLTPQEVRPLFAMLAQLRAHGRLVIFITHKLREVKAVADRVTVMRRGRVVSTDAVAAISEGEMAERMVGAALAAVSGTRRASVARAEDAQPALRVNDLSVRDARGVTALAGVSFGVQPGEIFGIAGVDGNGQRELFEVLVGAAQPTSGTVAVDGVAITVFNPRAAQAAGIGHIPPDRHRDGLVLGMTVQENFLLSRSLIDRVARRGIFQRRAARRLAAGLAEQYAVRFASLDAPAQSLSGGNQQRVVVARALAQRPRVLVTVNPTRGLDVAATAAVATALDAAAREGCAIVLISTDLDEVLDLSDRVSVLARGRLSAPLEPPIDPERLGLLMAGATT
jgi:simple sugar transport system ATP-binding protein